MFNIYELIIREAIQATLYCFVSKKTYLKASLSFLQTMPMNNQQDRVSRLRSFVQGRQSEIHPKESEIKQILDDNDDVPTDIISVSTRQDLVDSARAPGPRTTRKPQNPILDENDTIRANFDEPIHRALSPASRIGKPGPSHRLDQLLAGSELGESFMHSRVSTPPNDVEEYERPFYGQPIEPAENPRVIISRHPAPKPTTRSNNNNIPSFQLGEDLFMSVTSKPQQSYPADMKDGFSRAVLETYETVGAESPKNKHRHKPSHHHNHRHTQLPLREVKIQSLQHRDNDGRGEIQNRPHRWVKPDTKALSHASSDVGSVVFQGGEDDLETTPKGRRSRSPRAQMTRDAAGTPTRRKSAAPVDKKRRHVSADYDDMALSSMKFTDLQNEPFDFDPGVVNVQNRNMPMGNTLEEKLVQYQHHGYSEQRSFFGNMSLDEWEKAGDWFADQFSDVMKKLRDARRSKRRMIQDFEDEAAMREEAVRTRSDNIDRKLQTMKENGLRVVGEKMMR